MYWREVARGYTAYPVAVRCFGLLRRSKAVFVRLVVFCWRFFSLALGNVAVATILLVGSVPAEV
jgi:hypothetical protein